MTERSPRFTGRGRSDLKGTAMKELVEVIEMFHLLIVVVVT